MVPLLLDFSQMDPIFMTPTFKVQTRDGQKDEEMKFEDIIHMAQFLRGENNNTSRNDSSHQEGNITSSSAATCDQPTPGAYLKDSDQKGQVIVLSSPPGSGKTITAKEVAKNLQSQQIEVLFFDLKKFDDEISESSNLNEFLEKCVKKGFDKEKTAIIFEGMHEILLHRRLQFLPLLKQAAEDFGFVLITTRFEEEKYIRDKLTKENFLNLSIKELNSEEAKLFMKKLLTGVDWEPIWNVIEKKLKFPRTPQVLKMFAELLKNEEKRAMLSIHSYNEFLIYWHLVDLHVKEAREKHDMQETWFDVMKNLIEVAFVYLVKCETRPRVERNVEDIVNKVGLAKFDAIGTLYFVHKTICEFLVCLGLWISPDELPVFTSEDKVSVLWKEDFRQVQRFLDKSFQVNLNDGYFQEVFPNAEFVVALNAGGNGYKVLQAAIYREKYSTFFKFDLESVDLTDEQKNDLLCDTFREFRHSTDNWMQICEICDKLAARGAYVARAFNRMHPDMKKYAVLYLAGSNSQSIDGLVQIIREDKEMLNVGFMSAVRFGHLEQVRRFLREGADVRAQYDWYLFRSILRYEVQEFSEGFALHVAAFYGKMEVFEFLVQQPGMEINLKSERLQFTPLLCAAEGGQLDMFQFLLNQPGVNMQEKDLHGYDALNYAALGGNVQIAEELLLKRGFEINDKSRQGETALHCASQRNQVAMVEFLLENGADINAANKDQQTALHIAVHLNNIEIVRGLVKDENLKADAKDCHGQTALHCALGFRNNEVFQILMQKLDVNAQNNEGNTPLHKAAYFGNKYVVQILVENEKVQVNVQNEKGQTALHLAAIEKGNTFVEVVRLLLTKKDINLTTKTKEGKTALDLATDPLIIKILQTAMNNTNDGQA